jgi:hypothetical protein
MHVLRQLPFLLAGLSVSALITAQSPPQNTSVRVADGGVRGRMESIAVPPKAGAPFSLTLVTEWSRPFGNGGTITLTNQRRIMRDSRGRIYQERWLLVPKGGDIKSRMDVFQITDPDQHTWYNCEPIRKFCELLPYRATSQRDFEPGVGSSGPLPNGRGFHIHEDLGQSSNEGQETHGYRETTTINAGVMGNDKPMISMREFWFSPHLGVNLTSVVNEPQSGTQVFTVKELTTSEPEPAYFEPPAGFRIINRMSDQIAAEP